MSNWFNKGLSFKCTQCGNCCGGGPGEVRVTEQEVSQLAKRFNVSDSEFLSMFTDPIKDGGNTLREKKGYECIFYDKRKGCLVYEDRPKQCRTWPFWKANLETESHWEKVKETCPGIETGPLYTVDQILDIIKQDGTSGYIPMV